MTLQEAIEILRQHNNWRRGIEDATYSPLQIGEAIDTVVSHYEITDYQIDCWAGSSGRTDYFDVCYGAKAFRDGEIMKH